jgi:hypothetical protein
VTAIHPGVAVSASSLPGWSLLFAREPEADLDFDDGPEAPEEGGGMEPDDEKPSKLRPLILGIVVIVVAGGLYLAWDAGMLAGLLGPSGDSASVGPADPGQPDAAPRSPGPPPQAMNEGPKPPPAMQSDSPPPPTTAPKAEMKPAPPVVAVPPPMFTEGQQVSVVPDPALPAAAVSLNSDAGETRPGPLVSPLTMLIITDGEFRNNVWIYTVRTPEGATGWISERRLRTAKP